MHKGEFMKKLSAVAISVLAASLCAPAFAGDMYVLASAGRSSFSDSGDKNTIDSALISLGVTNLSSSLDKSDTGYKLQVGYQFTPYVAVEGGYVDLGKEKYSATFTGGTASATGKATGWNIDAVGILPINDSFSVFGKLGLIDAKVDLSATATGPGGAATASVSSTDWKGTWGVGAGYNINKTVGLRAEYERFAKLGNNDKTGESNVDLLSVGVVVRF